MKTFSKISLLLVLLLTITACGGSSSFEEGTYTGEAVGYNDGGAIKVSVEVDGEGKISNITTESDDTPEIADPAIEQLTKDIIESNSYEVDDITGATFTSKGFKDAVKAALTDE